MSEDKVEYKAGGEYWERKKAFVMGDMQQRPNLLKLLGNIEGKKVLESGCGTGFFTRKIAALGGEIYGCDIEQDMLNAAKDAEEKEPLNIDYKLCDIRKTDYADGFFDTVVSVGVLFHLDQEGWKSYLNDSMRILKENGSLIISIEHPFVFTKYSPTRTSEVCWAIHTPHGQESYDTSQQFEEKYFKSDGDMFISTLWHHPLEFIMNAIVEAGFALEEVHEIMIEKEDLASEHWGKEYGYPAFLQIKARK